MAKDRRIAFIGWLKLVKGVLLFASGIGLLKLLHKDAADILMQWINTLHFDPDSRYIQSLLARASVVDERKLAELSFGAFFYSGLLLTEGGGLLAGKTWAKYFSVIVTGSFLPLELWELSKHFTVAKVCVIALNVAIVWYLVLKVREESAHNRSESA